jgi:hypothetical protein
VLRLLPEFRIINKGNMKEKQIRWLMHKLTIHHQTSPLAIINIHVLTLQTEDYRREPLLEINYCLVEIHCGNIKLHHLDE